MPYPITRIPTDDAGLREARTAELRDYIMQKISDEFQLENPELMLDVVVTRRSDYDEVKVFLTQPTLVDEAKVFMRHLEEELATEGIAILAYVRTWTGPASLAA